MHAPSNGNPLPVHPALSSLTHHSNPRPARTQFIARMVALTLLGAALAGCRQSHDQSTGVELVTNSETPTPAMTFELRFEPPMVSESQVGIPTTNSPLVISPPVAGKFTWLSPHSGVFVPSEPLGLDLRYELTLRRGLQRADGQPIRAALRRTLVMPAFGLTSTWPRHADTNATSEPEVKLLFNADVLAGEAQPFMHFRDAAGRRIAADVRQGTPDEMGYELGGTSSMRTWAQEFELAKNAGSSANESAADANPTNPIANMLIVTPHSPLPLGKGWKLVVGAGLPTPDRALQLRETAEVPIGDVTAFVVTDVGRQPLH